MAIKEKDPVKWKEAMGVEEGCVCVCVCVSFVLFYTLEGMLYIHSHTHTHTHSYVETPRFAGRAVVALFSRLSPDQLRVSISLYTHT
jgi:hypothetical protein